jgi:hypothetical protein
MIGRHPLALIADALLSGQDGAGHAMSFDDFVAEWLAPTS